MYHRLRVAAGAPWWRGRQRTRKLWAEPDFQATLPKSRGDDAPATATPGHRVSADRAKCGPPEPFRRTPAPRQPCDLPQQAVKSCASSGARRSCQMASGDVAHTDLVENNAYTGGTEAHGSPGTRREPHEERRLSITLVGRTLTIRVTPPPDARRSPVICRCRLRKHRRSLETAPHHPVASECHPEVDWAV